MEVQTFTETRVCSYCNEPMQEIHAGDEGWSYCENCSVVEGDTEIMYYCNLCEELKLTEECDCNKPETENGKQKI